MGKFSIKNAKSGTVDRAIKVLIYGPVGVGKTTAGSNAPSPVFLDLEKGSDQIDVGRLYPTKLEEVYEAIESVVSEDHQKKTLVIDTIDILQTMIYDYICRRGRKKTIDDWEWHKGYSVAHEEWQCLLSRLDMVINSHVNVILIGHAHTRSFKDPQGHDHDRYDIGINQSKNAPTATLLKGWCDIVGFANYDTVVIEDPTTKRIKVADTGRSLLYIKRERGYDAKCRWDFGTKSIQLLQDRDTIFESIKNKMSERCKNE